MSIGPRDFAEFPKLIIGEGPSDCHLLSKFCEKHNLGGFQFDYPKPTAGWEHFDELLQILPSVARFEKLTDIALFCDTGDDPPPKRYNDLKAKLEAVVAAGPLGPISYVVSDANTIAQNGAPRLHVFMVPKTDENGGLESLCLKAAATAFDDTAKATMQAVDEFADKVCKLADGTPWTVEKADKLRLHAFIAATSPRRPGVHFYRQLSLDGGAIPLDGAAFDEIKAFLSAIAAL